jgi:DNA-binding NarL/FixJ family response regulator
MVQAGDVYLAPSLGARLFARSASPTKRAPSDRIALTPREDEILAQVSNGSTNKEIARGLDISEKTVKYYMTNIMQKLNVRNRVEAVVVARQRAQKSA